jgi:thiamine biosynthesis lipoprotein
MGGDIVVSGPPPGKRGWSVRVSVGVGRQEDMVLHNCAISTSGDAEQFVVIGGVRYSHVVDPHTGYALTKGVQATVICKDGLTSDPVSTALTLVDDAAKKRLLHAYPGTKTYLSRDRDPG